MNERRGEFGEPSTVPEHMDGGPLPAAQQATGMSGAPEEMTQRHTERGTSLCLRKRAGGFALAFVTFKSTWLPAIAAAWQCP